MRSWLSNWKNKRELNVEAELRAARPEPSARVVKAIASRVNPRPASRVRTRTRISVAAVVTASTVAVLGATGGFSSAASSISNFSHSLTHSSASTTSSTQGAVINSGPISAAAQYGARPTVSNDFSPNPAYPGASVTVNGTNFTGVNQITQVDLGADSVPFSVTGPTSLVLTVPADSAGGLIEVFNTSGHATTTVSLQVVGAPTITHVATNGNADTAEGGIGSTVVITGTNLQTTTSVTFNKKAAVITSKSATSITTTIPAGTPPNTLAKPGSLVVTNPAGSASFSYVVDSNGPTIATFKVSTLKQFAVPGNTVTVTGKNLTSGTTLLFTKDTGGFIAGTSQAAVGTTHTQWSAVVPAHAVTGLLEVTSAAGAGFSPKSLTIVLDAAVTGIKPNFGKAGASAGKVGDMITISGTSLTALTGDGKDVVTFPGGVSVEAKPTGDTKVVAPVPFGATGTGPITVDNGTGNAGSSADTFYVLTQPIISSLSTSHAASGAQVVITGQHLIGAKSVTFNAKAAKFTTDSDTQITAIVPIGSSIVPRTNAGLTVTNAVSSANHAFTVDATAPTIKSVTLHGTTKALTTAAAGDTIDITGTFLNTDLTVNFGSGSQTITHAGSPTSAIVTIPVVVPNDATTGLLTVDNGDGIATFSKTFTILSAPTLVAFSPGYGVASKTKVTIHGDNLAGVTEVDFVGTGASPVTKVVKVPPHKEGPITVNVPTGTDPENRLVLKSADPANTLHDLSASSGNLVFDIVQVPSGLTVQGGGATVAGGQITISGTHLAGITSVMFGKVHASFAPVVTGGAIDTTKLTVTIPDGATSNAITVTNAAGFGKTATYAILAVTKVNPTHAKATKTFIISGSGFKTGTTLATVQSDDHAATSWAVKPTSTDTALTVTVPTMAPDDYTLTITSNGSSVTTAFHIDAT